MSSRTYKLFAEAMVARKPVVCMYKDHPRALCPIILGHTDGAEMALTWQFDGEGSKGPVRGQWKCLSLAEVSSAEMIDGPWRSGREHRRSQSCVKDVDLDVNPDSPYEPKRRLPKLRVVK
jgi:hypothetical protein